MRASMHRLHKFGNASRYVYAKVGRMAVQRWPKYCGQIEYFLAPFLPRFGFPGVKKSKIDVEKVRFSRTKIQVLCRN